VPAEAISLFLRHCLAHVGSLFSRLRTSDPSAPPPNLTNRRILASRDHPTITRNSSLTPQPFLAVHCNQSSICAVLRSMKLRKLADSHLLYRSGIGNNGLQKWIGWRSDYQAQCEVLRRPFSTKANRTTLASTRLSATERLQKR
jgi:hypothetical protein